MKLVPSIVAMLIGILERPALSQIQTHELVPADAGYQTGVGYAAGMSGDWIVLGGPWSPEASNGLGAIWFYQRQGPDWMQMQHVAPNPPLPLSNFGYNVAIDGDVAVASAPGAPAGGYSGAGRLYVFERSGPTWTQAAILWANDALPNLSLGGGGFKNLAVSGTRILAGAPQESHLGFSTGVAYLFERVAGNWTQVAKLHASDEAGSNFFGYSAAIEGETLALGATGVLGPAGEKQGAVYVFTRQGGAWVETQKLVHTLSAAFDRQGAEVALAFGVIAAGTVPNSGGGAVYLFEQQGGTWVDGPRLTPADVANGDNFSLGLSLGMGVLVAGAVADDDQGFNTGSAYCFRKVGTHWVQAGKLVRPDGAPSDRFGAASSIAGGLALVTSPYVDYACPSDPLCDSGAAFLFSLPLDAVQFGSCTANARCGNTAPHGGCRNSSGKPALLAAGSSASVLVDELVLEASQLPPSVFGIFFMGPAQTSLPLGDGLRVVAPGASGLYRFGAQPVGPEGRATLGPGIVATSQAFPTAGMIQAGETWNFQFWYRDVQGPCANGTNVTNGVAVAFVP